MSQAPFTGEFPGLNQPPAERPQRSFFEGVPQEQLDTIRNQFLNLPPEELQRLRGRPSGGAIEEELLARTGGEKQFRDIFDPEHQLILDEVGPLFDVDTETTRQTLFDQINQAQRGLSEQIETNLNVRGLRGGGSQALGGFTALNRGAAGARAQVLSDLTRIQSEADRDKAGFTADLLLAQEGGEQADELNRIFEESIASTEKQGELSFLDQIIEIGFGSNERLAALASLGLRVGSN